MFITVEGGEGAGKSTLIDRLEEELTAQGQSVVKTREPGGTALGNAIRQWLLGDQVSIGKKAELLLFLAARAQNIEECIQPALNAGKTVLCDRFNDSTIAYQGSGRDLGPSEVQELCDITCAGLNPGLTLFLDVDPDVGLERTKHLSKEEAAAGAVDRIESEKRQFHHDVREGFLALAQQNPNRIRVIDANQSQEAVMTEALQAIREKLHVS